MKEKVISIVIKDGKQLVELEFSDEKLPVLSPAIALEVDQTYDVTFITDPEIPEFNT